LAWYIIRHLRSMLIGGLVMRQHCPPEGGVPGAVFNWSIAILLSELSLQARRFIFIKLPIGFVRRLSL